jgi:membrane-bound lytic murein transglycosylase D
LRERFAEGIQISRRYLPEMEDIFRREGVPVELTRLPLIESCFNLRAYSKAKAAGIWQFIPSTGRLYMRIDRVMDERRDPLISTRAAARFLKQNYETLGAWPLAITAYNHGRQGVVNGVKTVGTKDIVEIIRRYRGPRFGFASRNFYPEFLAAIEVERDHEHHFGPLQMEPPLTYEEVELTDFITLKHIAHCANTDITNVLHLNPAFEGAISNGRAYVPRGYRVRVPPGAAQMFQQRYTTLPSHAKWSRQKSEFIIHTVRRGQTLAGIARGYGTTTQTLQRLNGLRRASLIRVGQRLKVPSRDGRPAAERYATAKNTMSARHLFIFHKVRRGQTLASIARRYGTNVSTLRHLNGVRNVKSLQIGQTLRVPSS